MKALHAMTLAGLVGCAQPQPGESTGMPVEEKIAGETISIVPDYATRFREASPDQNYVGQSAMIGSSADGFDRYFVHFPLEQLKEKSVIYATLHFDALSGTCASSYDNTKCDLEMTVEAIPAITSSVFDANATWNRQPKYDDADVFGTVTFRVPYQGTLDVSIPVSHYVKQSLEGMPNYGLVLKVANDTETTRREQTLLHDEFHIGRAIQRDVLVGKPRLEVAAYK